MSETLPEVSVQGTVVSGGDPELLRHALDAAFDFRGDVTIVRRDETTVEGFLFDRRNERTLETSFVRILPKGQDERVEVPYADIAEVRFGDRDPAAGKSWEGVGATIRREEARRRGSQHRERVARGRRLRPRRFRGRAEHVAE